jgi:DUF4097 and DUF4098 domain-containing protein YvlB
MAATGHAWKLWPGTRKNKHLIMKIFVASILAAGTFIAGASLWSSLVSGVSENNLVASTNITLSAEIPLETRQLDLENRLGSVRIHGTNNSSGQWTWSLTVRARSQDEASRIAQSINCQHTQMGVRLALKVLFPHTFSNVSVESKFEVSVPSQASVKVSDAFGEVIASDLQGSLDAVGQNGEVSLRNIAGDVHARTSFAALQAENIGPAQLSNQNGEISVAQVQGPLEADTSFARLRAESIVGGARLHNQNGEILVRNIQGPLEARTSFSLLTAKNINGRATLGNQNGEIRAESLSSNADLTTSFAELNVKDVRGAVVLENQNGGIDASAISGTVKARTSFSALKVTGTSPSFDCHNQNGNIYIQATSPELASIQAQTSFGGLEIRIPASLKPAIVAKTSFGEVNSDFPIDLKLSAAGQSAEAESGTPQIWLKNQCGGIRIARQK